MKERPTYMLVLFYLFVIFILVLFIHHGNALGFEINHVAIELLKVSEGCVLEVYSDPESGDPIIGYGHNLKYGITEDMAFYILLKDIERAEEELMAIFPAYNFFSKERKAALIDMIHAMGMNRFLTFKKMIKAINSSSWKKASKECIKSKWGNKYKTRSKRVSRLMVIDNER